MKKLVLVGIFIFLFSMESNSLPAAGDPGLRLTSDSPILQTPHAKALDLEEAVTLEAWIRPERMGRAGGRIIDKSQAGTSTGYMLDTYPGNSLRMVVAGGQLSHDARLSAGRWTHVAGVFSIPDRICKLYIQGKVVAGNPGACDTRLIRNRLPLRIGSCSNGENRFRGEIHRATVYNRALTDEEIAKLAAAADHTSRELPGRVADWDFRRQGDGAFVSSAPGKLLIAIPREIQFEGEADPPEGDLTLWYRRPAKRWVEALPLGNGRLGAMVFGGIDREQLQLNEDTLWAGGPYDPSHPEALEALPQARKLIFAGKYREAHDLISRKMMARPLQQMPFQPLGDLFLDFPPPESVSAYRRELDLETAITRVTYRVNDVTHLRETLASAPDQVLAMRLTGDKPGSVKFTATLASPQESTVSVAVGDTLVLRGKGPEARGIPGAIRFEARVKIRAEGGEVSADEKSITVSGADSALIVVAAATNYKSYKDVGANPEARVDGYFRRLGSKGWSTLRDAHVDDHQALFARVDLHVGSTPARKKPTDERIAAFKEGKDPQLAELFFQFGRYLLIASSRPGTQPATLQGIWNDQRNPPWDSKYTININTEMNYWPAEVCNLPECHEPLFRLLQDLVHTGGRTARVNYGAGGWVCHHNTDLWRATAPIDGPQWGMWPTGGAWLSTHLWQHYLFGGDREFLKEHYPILRGAAVFFTDVLVEEPKQGWLVTCPSVSPELAPPGHGTSVCAGPTMDLQIIRDLFSHTIDASEILGIDAEFRKKLQETRSRLAPLQIGKHGQLQEWLEDWDNPRDQHRHVSHLYGLHPSNQITRRGTPEFFAAARQSLIFRGDGGTGWSMAWKINFWARLEDGDHAFTMLSNQLTPGRTYPNLFDAHPPFQIDGNFGATSGMAEMLLQSHAGEIHLLPALPDAWPEGHVKGLRGRGAFEVDMAWKDGTLREARIRSLRGNFCRIRRGEKVMEFATESGKEYRLDGKLNLEKGPASPRDPLGSEKELRFWLRNAIAHHHFSMEEAAQATGLKPEEVKRRAEELGIRPGKVPRRKKGDPLVILPYPGGRHPRIGFLDGAIDPLRETKASVFLPWEPASYVVIDLPEAIFSNLGLTYLAHTHIPTIWDEKKITLPETGWRRGEGGKLELTKVLPNGIAFGSRIAPQPEGAAMELWLRNGTDEILTKLRTQVCLLLKGAKGFEAQSNENKVTVKLPWGQAMAVRSEDGRRWMAVAWEGSRAWANPPCPCFHSDPTLPDCPPGATVRVQGRFLVGEGGDPAEELNRLEAAGKLLPKRTAGAESPRGVRVGAAAAEIEADDSMVIGGGIGPGGATGQEGKLRAAAVVIEGKPDTVALVACDILMMKRDVFDEAARRIEKSEGIPFKNILMNATHTHHAPTTITVHGYNRDGTFSNRVGDAIGQAVSSARKRLLQGEPCEMVFQRGREDTVGQNSRLLLGDGTIFWVGPRDDAVRPTGPFDPELPVIGFRRPGGSLEALIFNHSTHCIGTREGGKRSPGFYGLAAQDLEAELGGTVVFVSGAFGSTHNLTYFGGECTRRITGAVRSALQEAKSREITVVRSLKREFTYQVRQFDDAKEDAAIVAYINKRVGGSEYIIDVFRKMRKALAPHQGEERKTWMQALRIGDVAFVALPGEVFTQLGVDIKRRSPFPRTFIAGVANDCVGYIPDSEAYDLGGYQLWTGFHSLVERGTGERMVEGALELLEELSGE